MSGSSGREFAVPSFALHSFLQIAGAKDPGGLRAQDSWCTQHQSELWCANLSAGHSSLGRHLQGR